MTPQKPHRNGYIVSPEETMLITGANGFVGSKVVEILLEYGLPDALSRQIEQESLKIAADCRCFKAKVEFWEICFPVMTV